MGHELTIMHDPLTATPCGRDGWYLNASDQCEKNYFVICVRPTTPDNNDCFYMEADDDCRASGALVSEGSIPADRPLCSFALQVSGLTPLSTGLRQLSSRFGTSIRSHWPSRKPQGASLRFSHEISSTMGHSLSRLCRLQARY